MREKSQGGALPVWSGREAIPEWWAMLVRKLVGVRGLELLPHWPRNRRGSNLLCRSSQKGARMNRRQSPSAGTHHASNAALPTRS